MAIDGLLGMKLGMTQLFREDGASVPVTAIKAGPCTVTQVRVPARDGYEAVQIGFEETRRLNRPERGHLRPTGRLFRHLREVPASETGEVQVGQLVDVSLFSPGESVEVTGTSKGRGFTGVVKRHNFAGGPKTHGQSGRHRAPGSIGGTTYPGRVFKGTRMAGHWGSSRITVKNLEVVHVDLDRHLLYLKGAVPGASKGVLIIRKRQKGGG